MPLRSSEPPPEDAPELRTWNDDGVALTLLESKSFMLFEEGDFLAGAKIAGGNFYQYLPCLP